MTQILDALTEVHYLRKITIDAEKGSKEAYQLILSMVLWKKGDLENVMIDHSSYITLSEPIKSKPHYYFQKLYQQDFSALPKSYIAAEHTGYFTQTDPFISEQTDPSF
jgi:hypothetical protein